MNLFSLFKKRKNGGKSLNSELNFIEHEIDNFFMVKLPFDWISYRSSIRISFFNRNCICVIFFLIALSNVALTQNGLVKYQIIDVSNGRLIPARLTVLKEGMPFNVGVESQLQIASRDNTIYTASGTGDFSLPPGKYEFWFGKGMEYSVDVRQVEIYSDSTIFISATLKKEINTDGFVGGDMHLHTVTNSGHGDANLTERIISCAAEGLDWVVATDHNFLSDYEPYMRDAGLLGLMKTTIGNEVSTPIGHFNTFPLDANSEPVESKIKNGNILFENIRSATKNNVVIQINHPRWVIADYFNTKGLDVYFGNVAKEKEWSWDFDTYEVLNENYQLGWTTAPGNLQSVKRDWFNMMNRGIRKTGVGNSDSHTVVSSIAGVPRSYILSSTDVASDIDEKEIAKNIKTQRVTVACGIFPQIMVDGKNAIGETFSSENKTIQLQLKVQAASWVSCSKAALVKNGVVIQEFDLKRKGSAVCLDTLITVQPDKDSWYILIAHGDQAMFPMVGKIDRPVKPLGFTNAVWIDADGNDEILSVFDYAKRVVDKNDNNIKTLTQALEKEREIIPYAFFYLFSNKNKNAVAVAKAFFKNANTEQRRMLFRELAKTNMEGAQKVLEGFQKENLTPLEGVVLASYVYFPLRKNRVSNFKKRKNTKLDEHLNYLETKFTYIHSGAIQHQALIGWNIKNILPNKWENITADKNAVFNFTKKSEGSYFLKSNWKMRKDTTLYFYLQCNEKVSYWLNGKMMNTKNTISDFDISKRMIPFYLKKGSNELILQLSSAKESSICFHQASEDMLIDPQIKIEEVEHLGKNKSVEYLTDYHFKYHGFGEALIDGYRGTTDHKSQLWQGWEGIDAELVLNLGKEQLIKEIQIGVLVSQDSWIFSPASLEVLVSNDGENFTSVFVEKLDALTSSAPQVKTIGGEILPQRAKFIKVIAKKIESIPEWHSNKGNNGSWIFLDEVIVQ
ncbi:MAG: hypothetical protein ACI8YQ_004445 [Polaribacter sp.]|jgi:hypothetical protein